MTMLLLLLISLYGCKPETTTPIPTLPITTTPTDTPRWVLYENALSKAFVGSEGGLCEWTIYGVSDSKKEVYVWAFCQVRATWGRAAAGSAVIYLKENGDIAKVVRPRDGDFNGDDIRIMFPPDVQEKIFTHDFTLEQEAKKNMDLRRTEESSPLIVASGTPLP
jgi:hypothetical protein